MSVHNHDLDPSCHERVVDGKRQGDCMPDPRSITRREPSGNSGQLPDALPPAIEAALTAMRMGWVEVWPDDYEACIPVHLTAEAALRTAIAHALHEARRGWQPMDTAPTDGRHILAVVDGRVRVVAYGKTSHLPWRGFCLADQGVEEFDLCEPTCWMPLPTTPTPEREPQ